MRRPFATRFVLPALLALMGAAACTHAASTADSTSSQVILADEIARSRAANAYEAVAKLRHTFLSNRGRTSVLDSSAPSVPNVYLDGMPFGPLNSLNNIPAQQIASIRLYRSWEAQYKFGSENTGGVIEVTTKRE
jgi:TonB-dependent Receptor Plug Domain